MTPLRWDDPDIQGIFGKASRSQGRLSGVRFSDPSVHALFDPGRQKRRRGMRRLDEISQWQDTESMWQAEDKPLRIEALEPTQSPLDPGQVAIETDAVVSRYFGEDQPWPESRPVGKFLGVDVYDESLPRSQWAAAGEAAPQEDSKYLWAGAMSVLEGKDPGAMWRITASGAKPTVQDVEAFKRGAAAYEQHKPLWDKAKKVARGEEDAADFMYNLPQDERELFTTFISKQTPRTRESTAKAAERIRRGIASVPRNISAFLDIYGDFMPATMSARQAARLVGGGEAMDAAKERREMGRQIVEAREAGDPATSPGIEGGLLSALEMAPAMVASLATLPAGPAGPFMFWLAQESPDVYREAKSRGVSDNTAKFFGLVGGALSASVEQLQVAQGLGLGKAARDAMFKGAIEKSLKETIKKGAKKGALTYAQEVGEEAVQEATKTLSLFGAALVDQVRGIEGIDKPTLDEAVDRVQAAVVEAAKAMPFLLGGSAVVGSTAGSLKHQAQVAADQRLRQLQTALERRADLQEGKTGGAQEPATGETLGPPAPESPEATEPAEGAASASQRIPTVEEQFAAQEEPEAPPKVDATFYDRARDAASALAWETRRDKTKYGTTLEWESQADRYRAIQKRMGDASRSPESNPEGSGAYNLAQEVLGEARRRAEARRKPRESAPAEEAPRSPEAEQVSEISSLGATARAVADGTVEVDQLVEQAKDVAKKLRRRRRGPKKGKKASGGEHAMTAPTWKDSLTEQQREIASAGEAAVDAVRSLQRMTKDQEEVAEYAEMESSFRDTLAKYESGERAPELSDKYGFDTYIDIYREAFIARAKQPTEQGMESVVTNEYFDARSAIEDIEAVLEDKKGKVAGALRQARDEIRRVLKSEEKAIADKIRAMLPDGMKWKRSATDANLIADALENLTLNEILKEYATGKAAETDTAAGEHARTADSLVDEDTPGEMEARKPKGPGEPFQPLAGDVNMTDISNVKPVLSNYGIVREMAKLFGAIHIGGIRSKIGAIGLYKEKWRSVHAVRKHAGDVGLVTHEIAHAIDDDMVFTGEVGKERRKDRGEPMPPATMPADVLAEVKNLDYDKKKLRPGEGFAEFLRFYLTQRAKAQADAPKTYNWFTNTVLAANPELAQKLERAYSLISHWQRATPLDRIMAQIGKIRKTTWRDTSGWIRAMRMYLTDDIAAIGDMETKAGFEYGQGPAYKAWSVQRNASRSFATLAVTDAVRGIDGFTLYHEGLRPGLERLGVSAMSWHELDDFTAFLIARHALDVHAMGKDPGVRKGDAQWVFDELKDRTTGNGKTTYTEASDFVTSWNKAHVTMLADSGVLTDKAADLILKSYPHYIPLKRVMDDGRQVMQSTQNASDAIKRLAGSAREIVDPWAAMQAQSERFFALAGRSIGIKAVLDSAEKANIKDAGWVTEVDSPMKMDQFTLERVQDALKQAGFDVDFDPADLQSLVYFYLPTHHYKGTQPIMPAVIDGKIKWYELQQDLYDALWVNPSNFMQEWPVLYYIEKYFRAAASGVRWGAVGLRPAFFVRNLIRDTQDVMVKTEIKREDFPKGLAGERAYQKELLKTPFQVLGKTVTALIHASRLSDGSFDPKRTLIDWYGGYLSTMQGGELGMRSIEERARAAILDRKNLPKGQKLAAYSTDALDIVKDLLGASDVAPRAVEAQRVMDLVGLTDADIASGNIPFSKAAEVMFAFQRATTDFSRRGRLLQVMNRYAAFSNAAIQGFTQAFLKAGIVYDENARFKFKRTEEGKRLNRTLRRGAAQIGLFTVAMWLMNRDEEWYKELEPWELYGYWHMKIGDTVYKIPRTYEYGLYFGAWPEAVLNAIDTGEVKKNFDKIAKQSGKQLFETFTSPAKVNGLQIPLELMFNYSMFYGKPIDPSFGENLRPEDRYNAYTTETAKYLGGMFAGIDMGMSPAKIDHAIEQFTGGLGKDLVQGVVDPLAFGTGRSEDVTLSQAVGRAMGLDAFLTRVESGHSLQEAYEFKQEATQNYNSAKLHDSMTPEIERDYLRAYHMGELLGDLRKLASTAKNRDEVQLYATGAAMMMLGRQPEDFYKSPFDPSAPANVRKVAKEWAGRKAMMATSTDEDSAHRGAVALEGTGIPLSDLMGYMTDQYRQRYNKARGKAYDDRKRRLRQMSP